ncbi:MAG: 3-deoxy-manno-octulosonate cytidylyltransferase [Deltaproteobacteria bacterium]|nr:3-deoxy-manno-octulosonate cytidylyltransferase [Deltaproteobacteria bacterium]
MSCIGIIPARYGSSRFPGKPLADLLGRPLIQWVYDGTRPSKKISSLFVATDDQRIAKAVKDFGGDYIMTSDEPKNGTERIIEALKTIRQTTNLDPEIVVNVQADEPMITGDDIDMAVQALATDSDASVATIAYRTDEKARYLDPNSVKVVLDSRSRALYFSRSPIPYGRKPGADILIHAGVYAYRVDALNAYASMPKTRLELSESLEQLRFLENGHIIAVALPDKQFISVDTKQDLDRLHDFIST